MKVNFERERKWWDAKAPHEERGLADKGLEVNRALRWRELERHLEGVETVLDVGAGTGAFSIPLAERGFSVTHVDFSPRMLDFACEKARGLKNIRFVEANATDLSQFSDRSFDIVLNFDGAISFCGSEAEQAILESCRVTKRKLIVTVSNRVCMIPVYMEASLKAASRIVPAVHEMLDRGTWSQDQFPENPLLSRGCTEDYFGSFKAFLPGELKEALEAAGMRVLRIGGIGSLENFCAATVVENAMGSDKLREEFLDLCERFDKDILPGGPGTRERAGLMAVAEPGED